MASGGGASRSRSRNIDPERIFELIVDRRQDDLVVYLDSIVGASEDPQCRMIYFAGAALRRLSSLPRLSNESRWVQSWAKYAWDHVKKSSSYSCSAPFLNNTCNILVDVCITMVDDLHSFAVRQLKYDRVSSCKSSISSAMFPPLQANSNDVINCPIIPAGRLNQASAFNSRTFASSFVSFQANSTVAQEAGVSLRQPKEQLAPHELGHSSNGTPAVGSLPQHQPGSGKNTPQELTRSAEVLPGVDSIRNKFPSRVVQRESEILWLNVASSIAMTKDGAKGAAGVFIRSGVTGQFICASCFPLPGTDPALVFAAACCEGIKIAQVYQPTSVLLQSHLFDLLNQLPPAETTRPEMKELDVLLKPPQCTDWSIPEALNGSARQLALRALYTGESQIFFDAPPKWLVLA